MTFNNKNWMEEIEEGEMPLQVYIMLHPVAELSDEQKQVLKTRAFAKADSI